MIAAQPFQAYDDNPCRPRHFKPPPCAPVVPEGPARKALETCRARLIFTGILFACVFGAVALRVVAMKPGFGKSSLRELQLKRVLVILARGNWRLVLPLIYCGTAWGHHTVDDKSIELH